MPRRNAGPDRRAAGRIAFERRTTPQPDSPLALHSLGPPGPGEQWELVCRDGWEWQSPAAGRVVVRVATLSADQAAVVGDVLEVGGAFRYSARYVILDAVTIVSAAPVNSLATRGAESATSAGILAWMGAVNESDMPVGGSTVYTVQAGDISGGNVTLRLRYRVDAATRTLYANADNPLHWWVKNLG